MNYQQRNQINKELKSSFVANYPQGCSKTQGAPGESIEHYRVKCEVLHWLKSNGYDVWTEVRLKDGSRADILAIQRDSGYIIEILHSESEKRFAKKLEGSYGNFMVIKVYTEGFDYNSFKL